MGTVMKVLASVLVASVAGCSWSSGKSATDCSILLPDGTRFECGVRGDSAEGATLPPLGAD